MPEHTPAPTPARSLYGFFMYLFSKTILVIYCAWAFVPNEFLHYLNIYYYPQKYWATAIPIQCLVALTIFAFVIYPSSNLMLTESMYSLKNIQDSHSQFAVTKSSNFPYKPTTCVCKDSSKCLKKKFKVLPTREIYDHSVPQMHDLDVRFVSKKLYLKTK